MNSTFHIVSDTKFDFIEVEELRNEIRKSVMKAGRRKIVFVEGYDDKIIFEIVYKEHLDRLYFIDTSMKSSGKSHSGGCEAVKNLLKKFVSHLPNEKRFYGVIDRDLKLDQEIESERNQIYYDQRLFIFFERYTLENYFIEINIICDFLHDKSMDNKRLMYFFSDDNNFRQNITNIVDEILDCLIKIGAANLTIRYFDDQASFLEETIKFNDIEQRLLSRLSSFPKDDVISKYNSFESFIRQSNSTQKFASGKVYFSYQFNQHLKEKHDVDIQLNNHKSDLSKILKNYFPDEFKYLLEFMDKKQPNLLL
ncbi:MAG: DUF4435 domain-containing protein [Desulfamplus sp.]|nr:DUF4435 domain-containing protein [Desulfamplus sp.]